MYSSPDFDLASEFHPILGHTLYVLFIFITVVVLQSLLFSLFAASFQNVIDQSQVWLHSIAKENVIITFRNPLIHFS